MHPLRHMGDCGLPTDPVLPLAIVLHCSGTLSVVHMCVCPSIHLSTCPSVCLPVCLPCLSVLPIYSSSLISILS